MVGAIFSRRRVRKNQSNNQRIVSIVKGNPGITYSELLLAITGISPDKINSLIAQEKLFINFNTAPLAEPDLVHIFPTLEQAEFYEKEELSGLTKDTSSQGNKEVQQLLLKARSEDLETANARYEP